MNDLQIAVATTLGALLVVVAAWLLVMRRDAGQNCAKLLGFEFELSTPALVVLLIGAGLLIGPAFAPYRPGGWPALFTGTTLSGDAGSPGGGTILRQQTAVNNEVEPNNRPGEANIVAYGNTVSGKLDKESGDLVDYYVVSTPSDKKGKNRIIVRILQGNAFWVIVEVWNSKEETLLSLEHTDQTTKSEVVPAASSYLVAIRTTTNNEKVEYEFSLIEEAK